MARSRQTSNIEPAIHLLGLRHERRGRAAKIQLGSWMKYIEPRPFADSEAAARRLLEIANSVDAVQDGRIHIEKVNGPFLFEFRGTPAEYGAGLKLALERGWLWMHESGTYVKFTAAGAELFA